MFSDSSRLSVARGDFDRTYNMNSAVANVAKVLLHNVVVTDRITPLVRVDVSSDVHIHAVPLKQRFKPSIHLLSLIRGPIRFASTCEPRAVAQHNDPFDSF